MALGTKPRWDKYDGYVGNYRGVLAEDIDLDTEANVVLGVGHNSDGAIVIGSGQTGIKGVMIVAVGADIHGALLDGGINNQAGDPQDVGKHGEITNFAPWGAMNAYALTLAGGAGTFTITDTTTGKTTTAIVYNPGSASVIENPLIALDDGFDTTSWDVSGSGTAWTIVAPDGHVITAAGTGGATATLTPNQIAPAAGKNYYAHSDGTVNATKGSDGIYVGHTVEKDRLIVNVADAQPA